MNKKINQMDLDFLREQIINIERYSSENSIDLQTEIDSFKEKINQSEEIFYQNMLPWDRVKIARHNERPVAMDYIENLFTDFVEFHGDRYFKDDEAIIGGIGKFGSQTVTVIGQQKGRTTKENIRRNFSMANPEGYRKSLRLMKQAEKFNRPIITLIDTPGAYPGLGAEERGQAEAIARNLMEMSRLRVPVIAIIIGEGGSGGALGLGVANKVYMLENSIYSVISPEGLSSILWKDASRAQEAANIMKLTALDLKEFGVIDGIISEPPGGAHKDFPKVLKEIRKIIIEDLNYYKNLVPEEIRNDRYNKFRRIGNITL